MAEKNENNKNNSVAVSTSVPMRDIDYQVDSLTVNEHAKNQAGTGAYFSQENNTITRNHILKGRKSDEYYRRQMNNFGESDDALIHEQKHRDNYNQGLYEYPVNMEQSYKLCMYDEISANMASLILMRQKYLETGNLSVFDEEDGRFKFYKDAIKNNQIKPGSTNPADFDKEMSLIANGVQQMWQKKYANAYAEAHADNGYLYCDKSMNARFYNQNYEKAKKIALTVGGVDFSKYLKQDVEIPAKGKQKLYKNAKQMQGKNSFVAEVSKYWDSAVEKFKGLFKERTVTGNKRENTPVNPVNRNKKPAYRTWKNEAGSRVSAVQHRRLPDMTKDVIKKPANYKSAAVKSSQSANTSAQNQNQQLSNKLKTASKTYVSKKQINNLHKKQAGNKNAQSNVQNKPTDKTNTTVKKTSQNQAVQKNREVSR